MAAGAFRDRCARSAARRAARLCAAAGPPGILLAFIMMTAAAASDSSLRGPGFVLEPPTRLEFSNSTGGWLDCTARGNPPPSIAWVTGDGARVTDVGAVRRVEPNGTLVLLPFPAAAYRQDVHSATYRCVASNAVGAITSREVLVRAVVTQAYSVEASSDEAPRGCTAVLRCTPPSFVRDLVKVVSWMKEDSYYIYPSEAGDGKHWMLPTGELLVHNVEYNDQFVRYWCRTRHRLTNQVVTSSPTVVRVTEHTGSMAPTMVLQTGSVHAAQDEGAMLMCLAQGCPEPTYTWQLQGQGPGPRAKMLGPLLVFDAASSEDAGAYRCTARNAAGEASAELRLSVYTPLEVEVEPKLLVVQLGGSAEFRCQVSAPGGLVTWFKDGTPVLGGPGGPGGRGAALLALGAVSREDRGMYQCVVRRAEGDTAQAAAELRLGDAPPVLQYSFIEQTLQPGPSVSLKCSAAGQPTPTIAWSLDGFPLPTNHRFLIGQYVTVHGDVISHVNISHVTVEDGGEYRCVAENRAGQAHHAARLNVYGLPYIRQIPKVTAVAGETLEIKCPVAGFPIEEIKWERGSAELPEDLRQKVFPSGVLQVERVQKVADAGLYTCTARNKQGHTARRSADVQVIVPPAWEVEPQDSSVERGRHAFLHCRARGVPPPTTVWKKAVGGRNGEYRELRERPPAFRVLSNGTLALQSVSEDAEGFYLCQANNSIGSPLGKVVQLRVNSRPFFSVPSRTVTVKQGETAVLQCDVSGDRPISVVWLRAGMELTAATNYRVTEKLEPRREGVTAELQLAASESADTGPYHCQAKNSFGTDKQVVQLLVQEPPPRPVGLQTALVTSTTINLQWQHAGGTDADAMTRFAVEYRQQQQQQQQGAVGAAGTVGPWQRVEARGQHAAVIADLRPATRYVVRVVAEGAAGRSEPSQELVVRTEPQQPAGAPLGVTARAVASTAVLVAWTAPAPELRHGDVTAYNVGFRDDGGQSAYNMTSVPALVGDADDDGELTLTGLLKYTRYSIVVQAVNVVGAGPMSDPVSVLTLEDVPSMPPEDVRCIPLSSQSLQVSWQPPPSGHINGVLQGYHLHYESVSPDQRHPDAADTAKTTSLLTVLLDLRKATNYSVTVRAYTRKGDGVASRPAFCSTDEDAPGPPADIKVVVSGPQSLLLSWLPPADPNGVLTRYNVYNRLVDGPGREELKHDKQQVGAAQTSLEVKGLQQHVEYQFWVTASTRIGEGQSSHVVSQVPTPRVAARVASIGGLVARPWRSSVALACRAVGQPQPRLTWRPKQHRGQVLDSGELMLTGLAKEHAGNYTCTAENAHGTDSVTYTLVVQVPPGAPQLFVGTSTSSSILLHWKVAELGGAALSGLTLHYRRQHGDPSRVDLPRRATSHELKGLQCGTTYHLQLVALNAVGASPGSATLSVRTQGQAPGKPSAGALLSPGPGSVQLRLAAWPDNGCPLLYFVVRYKPVAGPQAQQWTLVSNSLKPQRRFNINGLSPASGYQLQVEAHNIAGSATEEYTFFTLTKDGEAPPPELVQRGGILQPFYMDMRVVLPVAGAAVAVAAVCVALALCWRTKQARPVKETLDTKSADAVAQRERYYATLRKVALQAGDKIPETSEDISPYATFQLSDTAPQNTLLHSFMYHEQAMTEAASPPPLGPKGRGQRSRRSSHHKSHACGHDSDESDSDGDPLTSSRTESSNQLDRGPAGGPQGGHGVHGGAHGGVGMGARGLKHSQYNFIYHGAPSSTSSDISPMSEQKSLPRRGRHSKWLPPLKGHDARGPLPPVPGGVRTLMPLPAEEGETLLRPSCALLAGVASTSTARRCAAAGERPAGVLCGGGGPVGAELSEAECDMDTMKKLKLGLRSSLWSRTPRGTPSGTPVRPSTPGLHPSDYSIAV